MTPGYYIVETLGLPEARKPERSLIYIAYEWMTRQPVLLLNDPESDWDLEQLKESFAIKGRLNLNDLTIEVVTE